MVGYIFKAENTVTGKTYIGKRYSVRFDKTYIGDDTDVLNDAKKYGTDKFIVNMIKACETVKECDFCYTAILKELNAESDNKFYNTKEIASDVLEVEKPTKKSRKKRTEE